MNEIFLGLALGFTGASFSWMLVKPLLQVNWIANLYHWDESSVYVWVQRAIAAIFTILWWL